MRNPLPDPLNQIRLANLDVLIGKMTQWDFAQLVGMSQSAINHFKRERSPMGRNSCLRIERALGLAEGAMDKEGGVSPLTDAQRGGLPDSPRAPRAPDRAPPQDAPESYSLSVVASNPMHYAVIDAFVKLVQSGRLSDERCSQMLAQFTVMRSNGARPRSDEMDSLLARLAVNEFKVVYAGDGGREQAVERLENEFGPAVAASFQRHLADVRSLPTAARDDMPHPGK
mgnify:FL=1